MKKVSYYIPLLLFLVLAIFFSIQLLTQKDPSELPSVFIEKKLPNITLDPFEGYEFLSQDLLNNTGSLFLINIWASWCGPCIAEHHYLMELSKSYNITIYGINYKNKLLDAKAFLENYGNPFTAIGRDVSGRQAINLGVYGVPETFIVDKYGFIKYRHVGPIQDYDMNNTILPIIKKLGAEGN